MPFLNRRHAGKELAKRLAKFDSDPDVIVLGLPRGGIPVAYEVASHLHLALEVFVVRKLGFPKQPELAMGAIASGGIRFLNRKLIAALKVDEETLERVINLELVELARREAAFQRTHESILSSSKSVIVVDDGLATGASMSVAVEALRDEGRRKVIVAVPVGSRDVCDLLSTLAEEVICLEMPQNFGSVGQWYRDFSQTTDEEVRELLEQLTF